MTATLKAHAGERRRDAIGPIGAIVADRRVRAAFQPLVDLYTDATVGYEALARGPAGSTLERPVRLFEAARAAGLERELEWACQRAALHGALESGLGPRQALFMNFEPSVSMDERPAELQQLTERALERFPIFVELTERALADRPAELLRSVARLRAMGVGIALDDVGADPRSLALMPFLAPEVIKLDLRLVQGRPSAQVAEIAHAVNAEAERTGALVLAEGIETDEHRRTALALGARYGQGWLFGHPDSGRAALGAERGDHPEATPVDGRSTQSLTTSSPAATPCVAATSACCSRSASRSRTRPATSAPRPSSLSCFQEERYFTAKTAARYSELSADAALVGALGVGLPQLPASGVRGVAIEAADPLHGEWTVTVIAPHFAMAFVARDVGDAGAEWTGRSTSR